jgi:hypothetical protein
LERHITKKILHIFGVAVLGLALVTSWLASKRQGQDFGVIYAVGIGIAKGVPIYDSEWQKVAFADWGLPPVKNVPYPPSAGFIALPFASLSYDYARSLWFLVMAVAVILSVRGLIRLTFPESAPSVWTFSAAGILLSACIRWGMTPLQGAPLVFGLLAVMIVALHTDRPRVAAFIAACVTALKFTVAFPFLALLLLHRLYREFFGAVVFVGFLNVVGFARMGGMSAFNAYRSGLQGHELPGTVDSPDPWDTQSVSRLDWPYMLNGLFGQFDGFRLVALAVFGLVCLWLFVRANSLKPPVSLDTTAIFLAPLVCINLLSVYHHHYDVSPLLAPLIVFVAKYNNTRCFSHKMAWYLMSPLILMMAVMPMALSKTYADLVLGASGQGLVNMLFPIATTMMLAGSLTLVYISGTKDRRVRLFHPKGSVQERDCER